MQLIEKSLGYEPWTEKLFVVHLLYFEYSVFNIEIKFKIEFASLIKNVFFKYIGIIIKILALE